MVVVVVLDVDVWVIFVMVNLVQEQLIDLKVMVFDMVYYQMLEKIVEQCDVMELLFWVGVFMCCDDYGVLGFVWKFVLILMGLFCCVEWYVRFWISVVEYELWLIDSGIFYVFYCEGDWCLGMWFFNEVIFVSVVVISCEVIFSFFVFLEVYFKYVVLFKLVGYKVYFGCLLVFGFDVDGFVLFLEVFVCFNKFGDEGIMQFLVLYLDVEFNCVGEDYIIQM